MKKISKKIKIIIFTGVIFVLTFGVICFTDRVSIAIDMYNFGQLRKVKNTLNNFQNFKFHFENLNDLNEKYNLNIKPIKNCYFTQSHNGNYLYIFGFKLESKIYKFIYGDQYYAYPKYDLPTDIDCIGGFGGGSGGGCNDGVRYNFENIISNPCQD